MQQICIFKYLFITRNNIPVRRVVFKDEITEDDNCWMFTLRTWSVNVSCVTVKRLVCREQCIIFILNIVCPTKKIPMLYLTHNMDVTNRYVILHLGLRSIIPSQFRIGGNLILLSAKYSWLLDYLFIDLLCIFCVRGLGAYILTTGRIFII